MQRQRQRPQPAAWEAQLHQRLKRADGNGRTAVAHLEPDQALPFLLEYLRKERRAITWEYLNFLVTMGILYGVFIAICWLSGWKFPNLASMLGPIIGGTIGVLFNPVEKRNARWRNGLQAYLALLERTTLSERLPRLLEVMGWFQAKKRLVTPETRRQYDTLLASSLSKAGTSLLQSLAPEQTQVLVGLVTHHRALSEELLVAALLAASELRPESPELREALRALEHSSQERVRAAAHECQRLG